jgi:hypothetical protein
MDGKCSIVCMEWRALGGCIDVHGCVHGVQRVHGVHRALHPWYICNSWSVVFKLNLQIKKIANEKVRGSSYFFL